MRLRGTGRPLSVAAAAFFWNCTAFLNCQISTRSISYLLGRSLLCDVSFLISFSWYLRLQGTYFPANSFLISFSWYLRWLGTYLPALPRLYSSLRHSSAESSAFQRSRHR